MEWPINLRSVPDDPPEVEILQMAILELVAIWRVEFPAHNLLKWFQLLIHLGREHFPPSLHPRPFKTHMLRFWNLMQTCLGKFQTPTMALNKFRCMELEVDQTSSFPEWSIQTTRITTTLQPLQNHLWLPCHRLYSARVSLDKPIISLQTIILLANQVDFALSMSPRQILPSPRLECQHEHQSGVEIV